MKGLVAEPVRQPCNPLDHDGFPLFAHSIIFKACLDDIFLKLPYVLTRPYLDTLWLHRGRKGPFNTFSKNIFSKRVSIDQNGPNDQILCMDHYVG